MQLLGLMPPRKNMNRNVRLSSKWFNPLYFHLLKYIDDPRIRKIMVYGGKSSAKTLTIAQLFLVKGYMQNCSTINYRKEQTTIKKTIKEAYKKAISLIYFDQAYSAMDFSIAGINGNKHLFTGLDTEGKVKGIESFKYLLFDELDQFEQEEWRQANLSLRGMEGQKLFATWNPVDENIWIKGELDKETWVEQPLIVDDNPYSRLHENSFVKISADGKTLLIKTTYFDNKWMVGADGYGSRDQNLIDEYEKLKDYDENSYRVNVLGEWGVANKEGKFCWAFDESQIKPTNHDPSMITWATFDFNVSPMTCTIAQVLPETTTLRCIECIKLDNSNIWEMCDRILASYPNALWMVTGDASGKNASALVQDNMNYYTIIMQKLGLTMQQIQVPESNPRIRENRLLVNAVLKRWTVEIDPERCKPLIYDLRYVEVDREGNIVKDRSTESKKADFLDNFRYLCNIAIKPFLEFMGIN